MLSSNRTPKNRPKPKVALQLPKLHREQARIVAESRRFNVLACGRRFGKTVLLLDRLIPVLLTGRPCAWFAPNPRNAPHTRLLVRTAIVSMSIAG